MSSHFSSSNSPSSSTTMGINRPFTSFPRGTYSTTSSITNTTSKSSHHLTPTSTTGENTSKDTTSVTLPPPVLTFPPSNSISVTIRSCRVPRTNSTSINNVITTSSSGSNGSGTTYTSKAVSSTSSSTTSSSSTYSSDDARGKLSSLQQLLLFAYLRDHTPAELADTDFITIDDLIMLLMDQPEQDYDETIQRLCLETLTLKLKRHRNNQTPMEKIIIPMVIVTRIMKIMTNYGGNVYIQRTGCGALWCILLNGYQVDDDRESSYVRYQIFLCILDTMKHHRNDTVVQRKGCGVLWCLFKITGRNSNGYSVCRRSERENHTPMISLGVLECILEGMKTHRLDPTTQANGYGALQVLTFNNRDNQEKMGKIGGIEVVLESMKIHRTETMVQRNACGILQNISYCNREHATILGQLGGVEFIVEALKNHRTDTITQQYGCGALQNLAFNNQHNQTRIGELGIERILEAIKVHSNYYLVQKNGFGALGNISMNNDHHREIIGNTGGIECIINTLRAIHMTNNKIDQNRQIGCANDRKEIEWFLPEDYVEIRKVLRTIYGVLWILADGHEKNTTLIGTLGGIEHVIETMRIHRDNPVLQNKGKQLLRCLGRASIPGHNRTRIEEYVKGITAVESSSSSTTNGKPNDELPFLHDLWLFPVVNSLGLDTPTSENDNDDDGDEEED